MLYNIIISIIYLQSNSKTFNANGVFLIIGGYGIFLFVQLILLYVFKSLGLSAMAKKKGIKTWYLAFVPFANTYLAGQVAGETRIFNTKIKNIGLITMTVEIIWILSLLTLDITVCLEPLKYLASGSISYIAESDFKVTASVLSTLVYVISGFAEITYLICNVTLFSTIFRNYNPRYSMLMSILCLLQQMLMTVGFCYAILVFTMRKKEPVNYGDYLKRRYAETRGRYGNPYNGNPYNNPGGNRQEPPKPEDPFNEFSDGKDGGSAENSPFGEFSDGKNETDNNNRGDSQHDNNNHNNNDGGGDLYN